MARKERRRSAQLLLSLGQLDRYGSFMTSPGPECTSVELENPQVWPDGGETPRLRPGSIDKVTGAPDLQSVRRRIYHRHTGILSFFFRYLRFCSGERPPRWRRKRLGRRIEP